MRILSKTGNKIWIYWVISPGAGRLHEMGFLKQQHPKVTESVRPEIQVGDFLKPRCLITGFVESQMLGYPHGLCQPELEVFGAVCSCYAEFILQFGNSGPCCQSENFYAEKSHGDGL